VGLQVVRGGEIPAVPVRPLLLQRDAEERDASHSGPHDLQEVVNVRPFLDVVREVEVRVVQLVRSGLLRRERERRDCERRSDQKTLGAHDTQKFISKLMWKIGPLAPTGIGYAV